MAIVLLNGTGKFLSNKPIPTTYSVTLNKPSKTLNIQWEVEAGEVPLRIISEILFLIRGLSSVI